MKRLVWGTLIVLVVASQAQPQAASQAGSDADRKAVTAVRDQEAAAINAGDVEKLVGLYTDDVVLMPPNEPVVVGKQAARAYLRNMFQQFKIQATYTSVSDLKVAGDWASERQAFTLKLTPSKGGAAMEDVGKGVHIYRRQAGGWKLAQDVWNSDKPAPPPATK